MKRIVTALAVCGLLIAGIQQSKAGDREWATAGKILTGVIAGTVIARAIDTPPPTYTYTTTEVVAPAPVVVQPVVVQQPAQVVVQPAPVVVYSQPAPVVVYARPAPVVVVRPAIPIVSHHYSFGHRAHYRACW